MRARCTDKNWQQSLIKHRSASKMVGTGMYLCVQKQLCINLWGLATYGKPLTFNIWSLDGDDWRTTAWQGVQYALCAKISHLLDGRMVCIWSLAFTCRLGWWPSGREYPLNGYVVNGTVRIDTTWCTSRIDRLVVLCKMKFKWSSLYRFSPKMVLPPFIVRYVPIFNILTRRIKMYTLTVWSLFKTKIDSDLLSTKSNPFCNLFQ